jgi:hypothetical protein
MTHEAIAGEEVGNLRDSLSITHDPQLEPAILCRIRDHHFSSPLQLTSNRTTGLAVRCEASVKPAALRPGSPNGRPARLWEQDRGAPLPSNGDAGESQDGPDNDPQPARTLVMDLVDQRDGDAVG